MKTVKTNAMRLLDTLHLPYEAHSYPSDGTAVDAVEAARLLGEASEKVFKTLVLLGSDKKHYVCLLPAGGELDLKAAAAHFGVKSLAMEHVADLKSITGYIRGGCSPLAMKKSFETAIDESARGLPYLYVSAGQIGWQLKLSPETLRKAQKMEYAALTRR